ncbi:MAG: hypothetical protein BWY77_01761 [bacterium ADurb.Bin431]|nr:MAG: hypothetical protein BWY77_01761 [bacterium ADurb.Bin431]
MLIVHNQIRPRLIEPLRRIPSPVEHRPQRLRLHQLITGPPVERLIRRRRGCPVLPIRRKVPLHHRQPISIPLLQPLHRPAVAGHNHLRIRILFVPLLHKIAQRRVRRPIVTPDIVPHHHQIIRILLLLQPVQVIENLALLNPMPHRIAMKPRVPGTRHPEQNLMLSARRHPVKRLIPPLKRPADPVPGIRPHRHIPHPVLRQCRDQPPRITRHIRLHDRIDLHPILLLKPLGRSHQLHQFFLGIDPRHRLGIQRIHVNAPRPRRRDKSSLLLLSRRPHKLLHRPHPFRMPHKPRLLRIILRIVNILQCLAQMLHLDPQHFLLRMRIADIQMRLMHQMHLPLPHRLQYHFLSHHLPGLLQHRPHRCFLSHRRR